MFHYLDCVDSGRHLNRIMRTFLENSHFINRRIILDMISLSFSDYFSRVSSFPMYPTMTFGTLFFSSVTIFVAGLLSSIRFP